MSEHAGKIQGETQTQKPLHKSKPEIAQDHISTFWDLFHPTLPRSESSINPNTLSPDKVLHLQRTIGNHRVNQLLQSHQSTVQREIVEMDEMVVHGDPGGTVEDRVSGVGNLSSTADGSSPAYDEETIERNSPTSSDMLPYTSSGWNDTEIMSNLGQYDTIAGTDSDSRRCVQAVAMASYIPGGPSALASYLGSISFSGMSQGVESERGRTALRVIDLVQNRIESRRATYGDLSWAQEAIHDLFFTDTEGTSEDQIQEQISPMLEGGNRNTETLNIWCNSPAEIMAQANTLPAGGQLLINKWQVIFNASFEPEEDEVVGGAESGVSGDRMRVQINGRVRWVRRIATDTRPDPAQIDLGRDDQLGHQLLILKDNTTDGALRLYEPEMTVSGQHLISLSPDGAEMANFFDEMPDMGIYDYVQITGRIIPQASTPGFGAP